MTVVSYNFYILLEFLWNSSRTIRSEIPDVKKVIAKHTDGLQLKRECATMMLPESVHLREGECVQENVMVLEYLDDGERIADFINVVYFHGRKVVSSDGIQEMDGAVQRIRKVWGKVSTWSYTRDFLRKIILGTEYLLIGIEHQTDIHLAMPVRVMGYDVGVYEKQIRRLKRVHRRKRDIKGYEFTSGISVDDRLIPVLTTVLYFGEEPWVDPKDLHSMMNFEGEAAEIKQWIPNYPVHVIEVRRYPEWETFETDLKQVFGYLRHVQSGKNIHSYLEKNREMFENLSEDTYDLLGAVTNAQKLIDIKEKNRNKSGGIDMCKAIDELIEMGKAEGQMEGRSEGEQRMGVLVRILLTQSQTEEITKAIEDARYREKLFEKYHL